MDKSDLEKGLRIALDLTKELFKKLGVDAKVKCREENSTFYIDIEGEDLGLLIGYHGENLESLQLLLGLMVNKNLGSKEWVPVILDIGGWKLERSQALRSMVEKVVPEIGVSKEKIELPPMPASQRRLVHVILGDFPGLTSVSEGEEPNRRVVIRKAQNSNEE